ncbi:uncharacterized protein [Paramisgurnus dabryanus]|uniref:uncharacterized protein n=1 Tax=Paramisgurnus dabryanus TaxID=90735 RepID=UPI0031F33821
MKTPPEVVGVMMKSTPSPPPAFVRVSERDLTEIELHSVESISDLHRAHPEHHSKGVVPPRPPPPSTNGTLQMQDRGAAYQTRQPVQRPFLSRLNDTCTSTRCRYFWAFAAVIVFLLMLILIFVILVQQSITLQTLVEMVKQKQEPSEEISKFTTAEPQPNHNRQ